MKITGHVDLRGGFEHFLVSAEPVGIAAPGEIKVSGAIGLELHRMLHHLTTAVPFSCSGDQQAKVGFHRGVERIQDQGRDQPQRGRGSSPYERNEPSPIALSRGDGPSLYRCGRRRNKCEQCLGPDVKHMR